MVEIIFEDDDDIVFESSSESDAEIEESSEDESDNEKEEFESSDVFGVKLIKNNFLKQHQIDAINWMSEREKSPRLGINGGILALTMGLGKTVTTIEKCMIEKHIPASFNKGYFCNQTTEPNTHQFPNLVVCSKTVAYVWKKEIKKFFGSSCPFLYFHKDETEDFNKITYESIKNYKIIITTYETVMGVSRKNKISDSKFILNNKGHKCGIKNPTRPSSDDIKNAKGGMILFKIPWNRIISDESHRFANPKSTTFFSIMCLYGEKKWCLSGTPLRNYSSDIYSQLRFCGYDQPEAIQFNYDVYERKKMYEFILCKDYKDTGIILPELKEHNIFLELKEEEKEIYDYYHGRTKNIYKGFLIGSYNFSNVLTLFLRLRQICISSYTVLAESSRNFDKNKKIETTLSNKILEEMPKHLRDWIKNKKGSAGVESAKINKIIDILKNKIKPGEKSLIFTSFKKVIDIISLALKTKLPNKKFLIIDGDVKKRDDVLNDFNNPDLDYEILIINYKVGAEGLNLVVANNVFPVENWWTPVVKKQACSRSYRIGQKNTVNIWNILISNSIEEKIEKVCKEKEKLIDDFLISKKKFNTKLDTATLGRLIR
jgi:SNF2 family DNA or RNA helicase